MRSKNEGDGGTGVYMREGTTSRVTAADRTYGKFFYFYSVSPENFGSTHVLLNDGFEHVWIRSPDFTYWIYSFSSPTQVTVQCPDVGTSPAYGPGRQITLRGTGVLADSSPCYIYSDTFKLMP